MRLQRLDLTGFMGVGDYSLVLDGRNAVVLGRNAAGKSTLLSAYTWLLFNRDSRGQGNFEVRPIIDGEPEHRGEHAVAATFQRDDGTTVTLKRALREKWVKPRGKAFAELAGTESSYYVDGVPKSQREFQQVVTDLFGGEKNAQVLSDPLYFAGAMPWQERRRVLLDLVPDVSDEEVMRSNDDLGALADLLEGRSVADFHAAAKARAADLKRKLDGFGPKIAEASRNADPAAPTVEAAQAAFDDYAARVAERREAVEAARAAERQAFEAMQEARVAFARAQGDAQAEDRRRRAELEREIDDLKRQMTAVMDEGKRLSSHGDSCPECGQALDKERVAARLAALRERYNALHTAWERKKSELAEVSANPLLADPTAYDEAKAAHERALEALRAAQEGQEDDGEGERLRAALERARRAQEARERVAELRAEERRTAEAYEEASHHVWLCEEFTRTKARLVEAAINERFRVVRWRLFEEQLNGGIREVAEATVDGVPWGNLNTGSRVLAGLDCIQVLTNQQGVNLPVWIDNAESLTSMLPIDSQVIQLRVSEDDPVLRVVLEQPRREGKAA